MSNVRAIAVEADEAGLRLDRWFRHRFPQLGHGPLEKLLRTGQIRIDGKRAKSGTRLARGQVVRVPPVVSGAPGPAPRPAPRPEPSARDLEALRAAVLFKDDWVIAIDKPSGLAVQGGSGQRRHLDAMLDALRFGREERPRLVHRLDKDTSGVLLLARTGFAARRLAAAFRYKAAQKIYWALVAGTPETRRGRIDLPLAKGAGHGGFKGGEKVGVEAAGGKPALTLFQAVETRRSGPRAAPVTWLALMPFTGRTHQLRAHCAALGAPILCDGKYGGRAAFPEAVPFEGAAGSLAGIPKRLMLHAREIALAHPDDETTLRVRAPLPAHMEAAWSALGFDVSRGERVLDDLISYAEGLAHSPPGGRPGRTCRWRPARRK